MRLVVVIALAALLLPSAALADGPSYVAFGGLGVVTRDGKHRFVAVSTGAGTAIERITVHGGAVDGWAVLDGSWGIPQPTMSAEHLEGLTRDGKKLVVAGAGMGSPTRLAVIDARNFRVDKRFELPGNFAYDALAPNGKTLYLTQYVNRNNTSRYVVRAFDLEHGKLLPGRIADKQQASWVMEGSATTRMTSADGRWVYTLFMRPGGYPFVHALDTVQGVAHCIGLPWTGNQGPLMRMHLKLTDDESKLALRFADGSTWRVIDAGTWQIARPAMSASFPWTLLGAAAGALALVAVVAVALGRRRFAKEALPQPL